MKNNLNENKNLETSSIQIDATKVDVSSFTNATGLEFTKELTKWVAIGTFMGVSDAIPGYSGGTTLALIGTFDRLVLTAKSIFKPEPGVSRIKAFLWMLPFGIGWILGVFGFAKLTEFLVEHNFGLELMFLFAFFIAFTIPTFLRSENPQIFNTRKRKIKIKKGLLLRRWLVVIGFLVVITFAIVVCVRGGINWSEHPDYDSGTHHRIPKTYHLTLTNTFSLIGVAFLAGCASILPGGSGAIIQLLFNKYKDIHWTIMAHALHNFPALCIFALSTLCGMVTSILALSYLLKHKRSYLSSISFGMLVGSIISIFIVPEQGIWKNITQPEHIGGVIVAILLAICAAFIINFRTNLKLVKQRVFTPKK